jgi:transposase
LHAAITSGGQLVCGFLSGGNVHDVEAAVELVEDVAGCYILGDRGYDSDRFRLELESNNNIPVIPGRKNRKKPVDYNKEVYKKRGLIERLFGKLKENRRLTVRYEKSDINFLGFILIGFLKIFLC